MSILSFPKFQKIKFHSHVSRAVSAILNLEFFLRVLIKKYLESLLRVYIKFGFKVRQDNVEIIFGFKFNGEKLKSRHKLYILIVYSLRIKSSLLYKYRLGHFPEIPVSLKWLTKNMFFLFD